MKIYRSGCKWLAISFNPFKRPRRESSNIAAATIDLAVGIQQGKRDCLARAITLIESTRPDHKEQAIHLLDYLAKNKYERKYFGGFNTLRLGIAGPPVSQCWKHVDEYSSTFRFSIVDRGQGRARL